MAQVSRRRGRRRRPLATVDAEPFRLAFEHSPVGIAIGHPAVGIIYVNPAMCRLLGAARDEVTVETFFAVTDRDEHPEVRARMRAVLSGELESYAVEKRFSRPDGSELWVRLHVVSDLEPDGTRSIVVHAEDITERKEVELALRASDDRFRALMRHSTDVVVITNPDSTIRYVSPAVEAVLGYSPEDFCAQDPVHFVHGDDRAIWREQWAQANADPEKAVELELRAMHADGRYRWFEVTLRNLIDDRAVGGVLTHFHDVTDRHRAEQDLVHQTLHDTLTDLPNRALLLDRLGHALDRTERSEGPGVAVLFVDLDRFKEVNDSLGHAAGDALLVEVGARLRSTVRPADTVARLAGDEFVICCEDVTSRTEAVAMAERVLHALREPFAPGGSAVQLGASVGIALAGRPTDTPETLLRDADTAMYFAKGHGRDRFEIYDDGIRARLLQRIQVETDLEAALDADELCLHYQPVFSLESDEIVAVEALLRWEHPERGLLLPDEFLGAAERVGLSRRIGDRVLALACAQAESWRTGDHAPPTTWVNLSAHQLLRPGLVQEVAALLARHRLPGTSLGLELSEADLMELDRTPGAVHVLGGLAELGCRIAIDNFGTGYSSLRYVDRYPVDTLKIDRSLIDGMATATDVSTLRAIVGLGRLLALDVTAAGVETPEQLACLRDAGCTAASGFLLAGPAPADALAHLLHGPAPS